MIGIAEITYGETCLYLEDAYYPFAVISESPMSDPLPDGLYVVRFVEMRKSKRGKEFPFCRLIKALPEKEEEMIIALSELSPETAKSAVEILIRQGFLSRNAKSVLNAIFLNDTGVLLWEDEELRDDPLLKILGIDIEALRRRKDEILEYRQAR